MKWKIKTKWILLITILATGTPIWFSSYHSFINTKIIWLSWIFTLILGSIFTIITEGFNKRTLHLTVLGCIIAVIIKFIIDFISDPSTHNLWPFEIVYDSIIAFIASLVGVCSGFVIKKFFYNG